MATQATSASVLSKGAARNLNIIPPIWLPFLFALKYARTLTSRHQVAIKRRCRPISQESGGRSGGGGDRTETAPALASRLDSLRRARGPTGGLQPAEQRLGPGLRSRPVHLKQPVSLQIAPVDQKLHRPLGLVLRDHPVDHDLIV